MLPIITPTPTPTTHTSASASASASVPREPLLTEPEIERQTVYPIRYPQIWHAYKGQLASFWSPEEIDFSKDRRDWNERLSDNERAFIKGVLTFFAASDTVVSLNLMNSFCKEVKVLEAQIAYTYQAMIENIHAEVYSIQIESCIRDPEEKRAIFESLGDCQTVRAKVEWARTWAAAGPTAGSEAAGSADGIDGIEGNGAVVAGPAAVPFAKRLLAFAIVEGLFFSGAFCAIYWIKQRNLMPGLTKSNEFIARDEGQHTDFACLLYGMLQYTRVPQEEAHSMMREAVEIEKHFITEVIPCRMIGMNADLMSTYIEYVADGLLVKLGYEPTFGATASNPFPFMDLIGMAGRSNFFEERVSLYQKADVMAGAESMLRGAGDMGGGGEEGGCGAAGGSGGTTFSFTGDF